MHFFIISIILLLFLLSFTNCDASGDDDKHTVQDSLTPYVQQHGSKFNHRVIRDCHQVKHGSPPHMLYTAHESINGNEPFVKVNRFVKEISYTFPPRVLRGHYVIVSDPLKTLSVLEPHQNGGCALNIRQTVSETSRNKCVVAMNAGYFDTKLGNCLGNVVSEGQKVHDAKGIQNSHFGLTKDGEIFTGYVSEELFQSGNFQQLVGGVIWILRNGTGFVNSSKSLECEDTEETGPMDSFINIFSARTSIGHDKDGNVILVQVDGKSNVDGASLYDMEILLKELGLVNAINLDGGGSATLVTNGTTANYPYDTCMDDPFTCDRKVSTIICVHSPYCDPINCNNHGSCSMGKCVCDENWLPPSCEKPFCGATNCSNNGICLNEGCVCQPGYFGTECNKTCNEGWFGSMCKEQCKCFNAIGCNPVSGACFCKSGFTGEMCQETCPEGLFGINCQFQCKCNNSCCDPVSGACGLPYNSKTYDYAKCIVDNIIKMEHLVKNNPAEKWKWYLSMSILGIITAICLTSCLLMACSSCSCYLKNEQVLCLGKIKKAQKNHHLPLPSGFISDSSSDSETIPMNNLYKK